MLAAPEVDDRIGAVVAFVPAGSSRPLPGIIAAPLTFEWRRDVPTLFVAADRDRFVPPDRVRELYERTRGTKQLLTLNDAGHSHFGDEIDPADGACPPETAHAFVRSVTLAHFDAYLRRSQEALDHLHVLGALA